MGSMSVPGQKAITYQCPPPSQSHMTKSTTPAVWMSPIGSSVPGEDYNIEPNTDKNFGLDTVPSENAAADTCLLRLRISAMLNVHQDVRMVSVPCQMSVNVILVTVVIDVTAAAL